MWDLMKSIWAGMVERGTPDHLAPAEDDAREGDSGRSVSAANIAAIVVSIDDCLASHARWLDEFDEFEDRSLATSFLIEGRDKSVNWIKINDGELNDLWESCLEISTKFTDQHPMDGILLGHVTMGEPVEPDGTDAISLLLVGPDVQGHDVELWDGDVMSTGVSTGETAFESVGWVTEDWVAHARGDGGGPLRADMAAIRASLHRYRKLNRALRPREPQVTGEITDKQRERMQAIRNRRAFN